MDVLLSGERLEVRIEGQFLNASVHDMSGKVVAKSDRSTFMVGNLRPGTYFVQARTTEGSATRVFTKI